jgi:hypothetical protein
MFQEKKKLIAAELKKVVPSDWKYSLSTDSSYIYMIIKSAPIDLMDFSNPEIVSPLSLSHPDVHEQIFEGYKNSGWAPISHRHPEHHYSGETLKIIKNITIALNTTNFDRSDLTTDYHCVGHYVSLSIGRSFTHPFLITK